jgi:hypothetical protein
VTAQGSSGGGLVAWNPGYIAKSYATGDVYGIGNFFGGGLVGNNLGAIANCYATGDVSGDDFTAGLAGANYGAIVNCYAAGAVPTEPPGKGLVGANYNGLIAYSYWDTTSTGTSYSAGGEGKTTAEMVDINTFCHWATEPAVWTIDDGHDRPQLAWQQQPGLPVSSPSLADVVTGSGDPNDPFQIASINDLNALAYYSCEWDKYSKLTADIDMRPLDVEPVNVPGFAGVFDGNGHSVLGFSCTTDSGPVGLFRCVYGPDALIKNLSLADPCVNATGSADYVGSLAGLIISGTIADCWVTGGTVFGHNYVGAIVGSSRGNIINCHATTAVDGGGAVGGLVGDNYGTISDCSAEAAVSSLSLTGGIVGFNSGQISRSHAAADVSGSWSAGGLAGYNYDGAITDSYATGSVSAGNVAGGLVGYNIEELSVLENCYAGGTVSSSYVAGGLTAHNEGQINNCYATGHVVGSTSIGGLVGYDDSGSYTYSFWNIEVNPDVNGIGNANEPNVMGISAVQMQTESTFTDAGWDFVEVWDIGENQTYPFLRVHPAGDLNHDGLVDWRDVAILANQWLGGEI